MSLELFKFVVQAVLIERDDEGQVVREVPADPLTFYSADTMGEWAAGALADEIEKLNSGGAA